MDNKEFVGMEIADENVVQTMTAYSTYSLKDAQGDVGDWED